MFSIYGCRETESNESTTEANLRHKFTYLRFFMMLERFRMRTEENETETASARKKEEEREKEQELES